MQQRVRAVARAYSSDMGMAMGIMVSLQLFGLLLAIQFIHTL